MNRRIVSGILLCCSGAVLAAASVARPGLPGVIDNLLVPVAWPAGPDADRAWIEIESILAITPDLSIARPYPQTTPVWAGYIYVQEAANRALREAGLRFWRDYPADPRVWTWLAATLDRAPGYVDLARAAQAQSDPTIVPAEDDQARAAWAGDFTRLREAAIASDKAPEALRIRLWVGKLGGSLDAEMWARAKRQPFTATIDFDAIGSGLMELGGRFPASESSEVRNLANQFLKAADRLDPAAAAKWRAALKECPNEMLRHLAGGSEAIAAARMRPLEMRFTAIDGREVDLARLRGKVVLIDFWAATWCGACKVQEPLLKEVYAKCHEQGFEIIGIACEMKPSDRAFLLDYVKAHAMPWPQFFDGRGMANEYAVRYGFTGIPQYLLLDKNGLLVTHTSSSGGLRNLEAVVRRELGLAPLAPGDERLRLGESARTP